MDISVIVPLYNEDESIGELVSWIEKVMNANNFIYEIIMIDDGSKDNSWEVIEKLSGINSSIKGIKFRRNYGKSVARIQGKDHRGWPSGPLTFKNQIFEE